MVLDQTAAALERQSRSTKHIGRYLGIKLNQVKITDAG